MAEPAAAGTAVASDGGHGKAFPPLDPGTFAPQLVWLALSFGLLYILLKRTALPRIGELIEERKERVRRDLEQAEKLKIDTEQALDNYERALGEARARASTLAKDVRERLNADIQQQRAVVDQQIAGDLAAAEKRIGEMKDKALAGVSDIAADVAGAIVARLTGKQVSKDEVQRALTMRAAE
jgi:F-type H+-transporting ATPase subunit b